jgi:hypothetical protein
MSGRGNGWEMSDMVKVLGAGSGRIMKLEIVAILMSVVPFAAFAADQTPRKPITLDCKIGPAKKAYGGNPWLVYACNDGHSVVFASAPGSKAAPFSFILYWDGARFKLSGQGTGDKKATDAAFGEIKSLTEQDITQLAAEATNAAGGISSK